MLAKSILTEQLCEQASLPHTAITCHSNEQRLTDWSAFNWLLSKKLVQQRGLGQTQPFPVFPLAPASQGAQTGQREQFISHHAGPSVQGVRNLFSPHKS